MIIDTHCHYNLEPLFSENTWKKTQDKDVKPQEKWPKHWTRAQDAGVHKAIVVGTDFHTSSVAVHLAQKEPNLFAAIGIHPTSYTTESNEDNAASDVDELHRIISNPKVVAIGETGLDYLHLKKEVKDSVIVEKVKNLQQEAFISHMQLAQEHNLPLIIHVRDVDEEAYWDVLKLLHRYWKNQKPFVLHCISGPTNYVHQALEIGGYIGVAGNVTYPSAEHIREIVKNTPLDRILLETDAPYLPPQEYRGKVCEPWMINRTAEFVRKLLGAEAEQFVTNAQRVFQI